MAGKRFIAVLTLLVFIVTSVYMPVPGMSGVAYAQAVVGEKAAAPLHVGSIQISSEVASVQERFIGAKGEEGKLVVAVQDAHGIFDAQKNIQVIIRELQDKYDFNLVALEGGAGKADHTIFRTFPDAKINEEQVDEFMMRAELSGGEAAAILNPKKGIFYGVENQDLYFQNKNSFLKALDYKTSNLHTLLLIKRKLDKIRDKIFPWDLKVFHKKEWQYRAGRTDLLEFLKTLKSQYAILNTQYDNKYPNVEMVFQAMGDAEEKLTKEEVKERERELLSKVEGRKLFQEIKELSSEIKERIVDNSFEAPGAGSQEPELPEAGNRKLVPDIKILINLYENIEIIRNLAKLEITRDDYEIFINNQDDFNFKRFVKFLDKYHDSISLKLRLGPAKTFYKDALRRDNALYENLLKAMAEEKENRAIIVAGGFHTDGLRERLKNDDVSFLILSPQIDRFEEENPYFKVMKGEVSYKRARRGALQTTLITVNMAGKDLAAAFEDEYFLKALLKYLRGVTDKEQVAGFERVWIGRDARPEDVGRIRDHIRKAIEHMKRGRGGEEYIQETLQTIEEVFGDSISPAVRKKANQFVNAFGNLLEYLKAEDKELNPNHLNILLMALRNGISQEKMFEYIRVLDDIDSGRIQVTGEAVQNAAAEAELRELIKTTIVGGVVAGLDPGKTVTVTEAISGGFLDAYMEAAMTQQVVTAASLGYAYEPVIADYKFSPFQKVLSLDDVGSGVLGVDVGKIHEFGTDKAVLDHEMNIKDWPSAAGMMVDPGVIQGIIERHQEQPFQTILTHQEQDIDSPVAAYLANEILRLNGELDDVHQEIAVYVDEMYGKVYTIEAGKLSINRSEIAPNSLWARIENIYGEEKLNSEEKLREVFDLLESVRKFRLENPDIKAEEFYPNLSAMDYALPLSEIKIDVGEISFGNIQEIMDQLPKSFPLLQELDLARPPRLPSGLEATESSKIFGREFTSSDEIADFLDVRSDEMMSSDQILSKSEILELVSRKIQELGGEPERINEFIQVLSGESGLEAPDYEALYDFFQTASESLHSSINNISVDTQEKAVFLGGDSEKLKLAFDLMHPESRSGYFYMSRLRMMSPEDVNVLWETKNDVIGEGLYTKKVNDGTLSNRPFSLEDNSLMNSLLYQVIKKARTASIENGKNFEDNFQEVLSEEFNRKTIQNDRQTTGPLTLFGNSNPAVDDMIKEGIDNDRFFVDSIDIFEDFYNSHLIDNDNAVIIDVGVVGSQPWLIYGTLKYLQGLNTEDQNYRRLTNSQKEMVQNLKNKKLRIALLSGRLEEEWGEVPYGDVLTGSKVDFIVSNLVEFYQSIGVSSEQIEKGVSLLPQPTRNPLQHVNAYFTSLVLRNVVLEKMAAEKAVGASMGVGVAALPEEMVDDFIEAYQTGNPSRIFNKYRGLIDSKEYENILNQLNQMAAETVRGLITDRSYDLYSDEGSVMLVYDSEDVDLEKVTAKVARDYVDFETEVLAGYMLAKDRLGDLFAVMILTDARLEIDGEMRAYPYVIVQEKVELVGDVLDELSEQIQEELDPDKRQSLEIQYAEYITKLKKLWTEMMRRGVSDSDLNNVERNYGITAAGDVIAIDVDKLTDNPNDLPYEEELVIEGRPTALDEAVVSTLNRQNFQALAPYSTEAEMMLAERVPDVFQDAVTKAQRIFLMEEAEKIISEGKSMGIIAEPPAVSMMPQVVTGEELLQFKIDASGSGFFPLIDEALRMMTSAQQKEYFRKPVEGEERAILEFETPDKSWGITVHWEKSKDDPGSGQHVVLLRPKKLAALKPDMPYEAAEAYFAKHPSVSKFVEDYLKETDGSRSIGKNLNEVVSFFENALEGKYKAEKVLGLAGQGVVLLARNTEDNTTVAVKLFDKQLEKVISDFQREVASKLQVNELGGLYEFGRIVGDITKPLDDGTMEVIESDAEIHYIVQEVFTENDISDPRFQEGQYWERTELARQMLVEFSKILQRLHDEGIQHRDIKPDNLKYDASTKTARILDLGLAHFEDLAAEDSGTIKGTAGFIAPEAWDDLKELNHRADLYGLGVSILASIMDREMWIKTDIDGKALLDMKGVRIFWYDMINAIDNGFYSDIFPDWYQERAGSLREVFEKLVHLDPAYRYQSTQELLDDISERGLLEPLDESVIEEAAMEPMVAPEKAPLPLTETVDLTPEKPEGAVDTIKQISNRLLSNVRFRSAITGDTTILATLAPTGAGAAIGKSLGESMGVRGRSLGVIDNIKTKLELLRAVHSGEKDDRELYRTQIVLPVFPTLRQITRTINQYSPYFAGRSLDPKSEKEWGEKIYSDFQKVYDRLPLWGIDAKTAGMLIAFLREDYVYDLDLPKKISFQILAAAEDKHFVVGLKKHFTLDEITDLKAAMKNEIPLDDFIESLKNKEIADLETLNLMLEVPQSFGRKHNILNNTLEQLELAQDETVIVPAVEEPIEDIDEAEGKSMGTVNDLAFTIENIRKVLPRVEGEMDVRLRQLLTSLEKTFFQLADFQIKTAVTPAAFQRLLNEYNRRSDAPIGDPFEMAEAAATIEKALGDESQMEFLTSKIEKWADVLNGKYVNEDFYRFVIEDAWGKIGKDSEGRDDGQIMLDVQNDLLEQLLTVDPQEISDLADDFRRVSELSQDWVVERSEISAEDVIDETTGERLSRKLTANLKIRQAAGEKELLVVIDSQNPAAPDVIGNYDGKPEIELINHYLASTEALDREMMYHLDSWQISQNYPMSWNKFFSGKSLGEDRKEYDLITRLAEGLLDALIEGKWDVEKFADEFAKLEFPKSKEAAMAAGPQIVSAFQAAVEEYLENQFQEADGSTLLDNLTSAHLAIDDARRMIPEKIIEARFKRFYPGSGFVQIEDASKEGVLPNVQEALRDIKEGILQIDSQGKVSLSKRGAVGGYLLGLTERRREVAKEFNKVGFVEEIGINNAEVMRDMLEGILFKNEAGEVVIASMERDAYAERIAALRNKNLISFQKAFAGQATVDFQLSKKQNELKLERTTLTLGEAIPYIQQGFILMVIDTKSQKPIMKAAGMEAEEIKKSVQKKRLKSVEEFRKKYPNYGEIKVADGAGGFIIINADEAVRDLEGGTIVLKMVEGQMILELISMSRNNYTNLLELDRDWHAGQLEKSGKEAKIGGNETVEIEGANKDLPFPTLWEAAFYVREGKLAWKKKENPDGTITMALYSVMMPPMEFQKSVGETRARSLGQINQEALIGEKLIAGVQELNDGRDPKIITITGGLLSSRTELNKALTSSELDDEEYVILNFHKDMGPMGAGRQDHRIAADKVKNLRERNFQLWQGSVSFGAFEFLIDFSVYPESGHAHLHNIDPAGIALSERGIASEAVQIVADQLAANYPGIQVSTVAAENRYLKPDEFKFVPYVMEKHFNAVRADEGTVEKIKDIVFIDPVDLNSVYVGKAGGEEIAAESLGAQKLLDIFRRGAVVESVTTSTDPHGKVHTARFVINTHPMDPGQPESISFALEDAQGKKTLMLSGGERLDTNYYLSERQITDVISEIKDMWDQRKFNIYDEDAAKRLRIVLGVLSEEEKEAVDRFAKELADELVKMGGVTLPDINEAQNIMEGSSVDQTRIMLQGLDPNRVVLLVYETGYQRREDDPSFPDIENAEVKAEVFRILIEEFKARSLGASLGGLAREIHGELVEAGYNQADVQTVFQEMEERRADMTLKLDEKGRPAIPNVIYQAIMRSGRPDWLEDETVKNLQGEILKQFTARSLGVELENMKGFINVINGNDRLPKPNAIEAARDVRFGLLAIVKNAEGEIVGVRVISGFPELYQKNLLEQRKAEASRFSHRNFGKGLFELANGDKNLAQPNYNNVISGLGDGNLVLREGKIYVVGSEAAVYQDRLDFARESKEELFRSNNVYADGNFLQDELFSPEFIHGKGVYIKGLGFLTFEDIARHIRYGWLEYVPGQYRKDFPEDFMRMVNVAGMTIRTYLEKAQQDRRMIEEERLRIEQERLRLEEEKLAKEREAKALLYKERWENLGKSGDETAALADASELFVEPTYEEATEHIRIGELDVIFPEDDVGISIPEVIAVRGAPVYQAWLQDTKGLSLGDDAKRLLIERVTSGKASENKFLDTLRKTWIADDLWAEFVKLNKKREPQMVYLRGEADFTAKNLRPALERIAEEAGPEELVTVIEELRFPDRTEYVVVMDTVQRLRDNAYFLSAGAVALSEFQYVFNASAYPNTAKLSFHNISLPRVLIKGKQKFGSSAMERIVQFLEKNFNGWEINARATDIAVAHWFDKYFDADIALDSDSAIRLPGLERVREDDVYDFMVPAGNRDVGDYLATLEGRFGTGEKLAIAYAKYSVPVVGIVGARSLGLKKEEIDTMLARHRSWFKSLHLGEYMTYFAEAFDRAAAGLLLDRDEYLDFGGEVLGVLQAYDTEKYDEDKVKEERAELAPIMAKYKMPVPSDFSDIIQMRRYEAKSLGTDQLEFLSSYLILSEPADISNEAKADLIRKLQEPEYVLTLEEQIYQHVMKNVIPRTIDEEAEALRLLVQSRALMDSQALATHLSTIIDRLLDGFNPELIEQPEKMKAELTMIFAGVVDGIDWMGIKKQIETKKDEYEDARADYANSMVTTEEIESMAKVKAAVLTELGLVVQAVKEAERSTTFGTDMGPVPDNYDLLSSLFKNVIKTVPSEDGRPLFKWHAFFAPTEKEKPELLRKLIKENPMYSNLLTVKSTRNFMEQAKRLVARGEREETDVIFLISSMDRLVDVKGANALLHNSADVPEALMVANEVVAQAAVGFASALKLDKEDPARIEFERYLRESLGFTVTYDTENNQYLVSFSLRDFMKNLLERQKAEIAIARAA